MTHIQKGSWIESVGVHLSCHDITRIVLLTLINYQIGPLFVMNIVRTLKVYQKISGLSESSGRSGKRDKSTLVYRD